MICIVGYARWGGAYQVDMALQSPFGLELLTADTASLAMVVRAKGLVHRKLVRTVEVLVAPRAIVVLFRGLFVPLHLLLGVEGHGAVLVGAFKTLDGLELRSHCGRVIVG